MREILFRGKIKGTNDWFYGSLVHELSDDTFYILDVNHIGKGTKFNDLGFEVEEYTIGQFTGLLDKKGVKIFEGDRLHLKDEVGKTGKVIVGFQSGSFIVFKGLAARNIGFFNVERNEIEVIGNIHDNEEGL